MEVPYFRIYNMVVVVIDDDDDDDNDSLFSRRLWLCGKRTGAYS